MRGEMRLADTPRSTEMASAHGDEHVRRMATAFLEGPGDGMVKILALVLTSAWNPASHRNMVIVAGIPNEDHELAFELLECGNELWAKPAGEFCRGALLEQVTAGLLMRRECAVLEEQRVGPLDPRWWTDGMSDPIDFVLPDGPEFYECKTNIRKIASKHVNQFGLIHDLDPLSLTAFVTLQKAATLADWLSEFAVTRPILAFTWENILAAARGPADMQVAP